MHCYIDNYYNIIKTTDRMNMQNRRNTTMLWRNETRKELCVFCIYCLHINTYISSFKEYIHEFYLLCNFQNLFCVKTETCISETVIIIQALYNKYYEGVLFTNYD